MYHTTPPQMSSACSGLTREAARELLTWDLADLCASASRLRTATFGSAVQLCAIINAKSGNCGMDCRFCSQSGHYNAAIQTFTLLDSDALRARIHELRSMPIRHCGVVTSGGSLQDADIVRLIDVFQAESGHDSPRLCASLGRLGGLELAALQTAGMTRYHHNLETNESHYPNLCTTQQWRDRLATVRTAQALGLEVCCGGLFGTGETWDDRIDFALQLAKEGIRSIPINFLHPQPGTPLAGQPRLEADEALRIIALFRHILPQATLRVCGGRTTVLGTRQDELFAAGANALMTGNYLTTSGETVREDLDMIARLGLVVER